MLKQLKYFQSVVRLNSFSEARGGKFYFRKFYFSVCHLSANTGVGAGAGISAAGTEKSHLCADTRRGILLSKEPDPNGGL